MCITMKRTLCVILSLFLTVGSLFSCGGDENITKENADFVIDLKVGQKCKFVTSSEISGYEMSGVDCVEFNGEYTVMTATKKGVRNGCLYLGSDENEVSKSVYITVEENSDNASLEDVTINLDEK